VVSRSRHQRVDVADDTFLVAPRGTVADEVHDRGAWAVWWPDLRLTVTRDRGMQGLHWSIDGALCGSMEIWLEPWGDGVVLHWYLRATVAGGGRRPRGVSRRPGRELDRRTRAWKGHVHALKDRLEAGREPGSPADAVPQAIGERRAGVKEADRPAELT
jgi:hypothetical protein